MRMLENLDRSVQRIDRSIPANFKLRDVGNENFFTPSAIDAARPRRRGDRVSALAEKLV
jgi:hypothetical protein